MHQAVAPTPHRRRRGVRLAFWWFVLIALATLTPSAQQTSTTALCIICGDIGLVDVILNVLLFMPFGAGLALAGMRPWRATGLICAVTLSIEALQLYLIAGRDASVGDVLMNSIGGVLGFVLVAESPRWLRPHRYSARILAAVWSGVWLAVQALSSYAVSPSITTHSIYGQINRGENTRFPGTVLGVAVGGMPIPDHKVDDSPRLAQLLSERSTPVEARVIPNGPTSRPAPIVRIVDSERNELAMLEESRSDMIFSLRTRSSAWHLRPLLFRLPGAFPPRDSARADTLHLVARYGQSEVLLEATSARHSVSGSIRLSPSLAWTMVFPFTVYSNGAPIKAFLASLWIAALVVPLGYWSWCALRPENRSGNLETGLPWGAAVASVLGAGMAIVPMLFGLHPAASWEWVAAIAGVAFGLRRAAAPRLREASSEVVPSPAEAH